MESQSLNPAQRHHTGHILELQSLLKLHLHPKSPKAA